jgi:hypothetical protein
LTEPEERGGIFDELLPRSVVVVAYKSTRAANELALANPSHPRHVAKTCGQLLERMQSTGRLVLLKLAMK